MSKTRNKKLIIIIIVLTFAIGVMSLGFAAFSNTLTISSAATVNPNPEDFKMVIYGFKDKESVDYFVENGFTFSDSLLSDSVGFAYENEQETETDAAIIDNSNHTISNIKVYIKNAGKAIYPFIVKNDSKYDAYLDLTNMQKGEETALGNIINKTCTPAENTSPTLVAAACEGVIGIAGVFDPEKVNVKTITEDYYKIPVGGYEILAINIEYYGPYADGDFDVTFENFQFKFSTTK